MKLGDLGSTKKIEKMRPQAWAWEVSGDEEFNTTSMHIAQAPVKRFASQTRRLARETGKWEDIW